MTLREQAIQAMGAGIDAAVNSAHEKYAGRMGMGPLPDGFDEDYELVGALDGLLQWLRDNMRAVGLAAFLKDGCSQAEDYDHEDEWYAPASTMQEQPLLDLCDLLGGGETQ